MGQNTWGGALAARAQVVGNGCSVSIDPASDAAETFGSGTQAWPAGRDTWAAISQAGGRAGIRQAGQKGKHKG